MHDYRCGCRTQQRKEGQQDPPTGTWLHRHRRSIVMIPSLLRVSPGSQSNFTFVACRFNRSSLSTFLLHRAANGSQLSSSFMCGCTCVCVCVGLAPMRVIVSKNECLILVIRLRPIKLFRPGRGSETKDSCN